MLAKIVVVVLVGVTLAAPEEQEKRQIIGVGTVCPNPFQLTSNPCQSSQGRVYYAVPGDVSKFVQCDTLGRAYVVQCPQGLVYNQATTSCQSPQPLVTQSPVVTGSACSSQAIQSGNIFFPVPGDKTRFYECTSVGQAQVLQCPQGLVWDTLRKACIYITTGAIINPTVYPNTLQFTNPCTVQQLAGNHHYFAHPDPTRFIQCDDAGEAFVVSCPSGLVWNQYSETCASAYAQLGTNAIG